MHISSSDPLASGDPRRRPGRGATGTWVRLAVLVLLGVLLGLSSTVERTGALLTDTVRTSSVVSTVPEFPPAEVTTTSASTSG